MFENASAVFLARLDPRCSACAVRPHPRGRSSRDPDPRRAYPVGWHSASPGTQPTDCGSCRARRADQDDGAHHRRVVPDVPQDPERPAPRYIPAASERARCLVAHARGRVERRMQGWFRTLAAPEGIRLYRPLRMVSERTTRRRCLVAMGQRSGRRQNYTPQIHKVPDVRPRQDRFAQGTVHGARMTTSAGNLSQTLPSMPATFTSTDSGSEFCASWNRPSIQSGRKTPEDKSP